MEKEFINLNFYQLFGEQEEEANEINKQIYNLIRTCSDVEVIEKTIKEKYGNGKEFFEYTYLSDLINSLTTNDFQYGTDILLIEMKKLLAVKGIKDFGNEKYCIELEEEKIEFRTISSFLEKTITQKEIEKDNILKKYYTTVQDENKRSHKCHLLALDMTRILSRYYGFNTTLVTGFNSYFVPNNKYLHSWIELESNGRSYVLDSTSNIIMNKEGYYLLRQVQEDEIMSKISSKHIIEDQEKYGEFLEELDLKTYLTSRDEIIRDLEKNKHLFDNGEER